MMNSLNIDLGYFLSILLCWQVASCQTITLGKYNQDNAETSCVSGLVRGDMFVYYGTLDTNGVDIDSNDAFKWSPVFRVAKRGPSATAFTKLCEISAYTSDCDEAKYDPECRCVNYTGNVLTYEVRYQASTEYSMNEIQADWFSNDRAILKKSQISTNPTIYDTAVTTLLVNGSSQAQDLLSVVEGETYEIKWCVDNLASGSTIDIKLDGNQVAVNPTNSNCTTSYYLTATKDVIEMKETLYCSYTEVNGCGRKRLVIIVITDAGEGTVCDIEGDGLALIILCCIFAAAVNILSIVIGILGIRNLGKGPLRIILIFLIVCWVLLLILQIVLLILCIIKKDADLGDCEVKRAALIVLLITCTAHVVAVIIVIKKRKECFEALSGSSKQNSRGKPDGDNGSGGNTMPMKEEKTHKHIKNNKVQSI